MSTDVPHDLPGQFARLLPVEALRPAVERYLRVAAEHAAAATAAANHADTRSAVEAGIIEQHAAALRADPSSTRPADDKPKREWQAEAARLEARRDALAVAAQHERRDLVSAISEHAEQATRQFHGDADRARARLDSLLAECMDAVAEVDYALLAADVVGQVVERGMSERYRVKPGRRVVLDHHGTEWTPAGLLPLMTAYRQTEPPAVEVPVIEVGQALQRRGRVGRNERDEMVGGIA